MSPLVILTAAALLVTSGQAYKLKVQVDDDFKLYSNGNEIMSGSGWSTVYEEEVGWVPQIAIYASNIPGNPNKGIKLSIDGQATHTSQWACKAVSRENEISGVYLNNYNDYLWDGPGFYSGGFWAKSGDKCVCRLTVVKLGIQVKGRHVFYSDGQLISSGTSSTGTLKTFKVGDPAVISLYAEKSGSSGSKGFIIKDNGNPIAAYKWKCKKVAGQFAISGWYANHYDDSSWGDAVAIDGNWLWAKDGGDNIYCRRTYGDYYG